MILFHNPAKEKFNKTINNAMLIYSEAMNCFQPCCDVYWHYYYVEQMHSLTLTISIKDLKYSLTTLNTYIKQLKKLETSILDEFGNQERIIKTNKDKYNKFINWKNELMNRIDLLLVSIPKINNYKDYPELIFILKNLPVIKINLSTIEDKKTLR